MSADSSIIAAAIARNRRMVKSTKAREQRVHYIIIAIGWLLAVMVSSKHTANCERKVASNHEPYTWQKIGGRRSLNWRKLKFVEYNIAKLSDIEV